jgi:tetratricopeptide (TPR) repeat protein
MRARRSLPALLAFCALLSPGAFSQMRPGVSAPVSPSDANMVRTYAAPDLEVHVKSVDNKSIDVPVLIQLINANGQLYQQASTKNGQVRFNQVPKSEFHVLVTAPGYQRFEQRLDLQVSANLATLDVHLTPLSDAEDSASAKGLAALNPKTQKEVGKALEALRANKPNNALNHLTSAQKQSPNSAEVEYLFGVYSLKINEPTQALSHWNNALTYDPKHLSTLLELGQELLYEKRTSEATSYLERAIDSEPSSWRAHALLAEADYMQKNPDEAISHAQRALDLGHERAASIQPLLAGILAERGDTARATTLLQDYLKSNPSDSAAANQLANLKNPQPASTDAVANFNVLYQNVSAAATALPLPTAWMPTDVDEKIPPVEPSAVCPLDDLLRKTGEQLVTLVHDVDRYTATESVVDQNINKWGVASPPERRKFSYLVDISEIRPGLLSVNEYRDSGTNPGDFPGGIATHGLPALVLIFHPFYVGNYEITCEGLARLNSGLAWQVHFRQRPDKPVSNRGYRVGAFGSLYPVALRGRAWISADTNQIVRLETDLVQGVPEIHLVAEHAAIEYGAVNFRQQNLELWLPHTAEIYFDWRGQRVHRRHSFDDYFLFSVDENQRIHAPKLPPPPTDPDKTTSSDTPTPASP